MRGGRKRAADVAGWIWVGKKRVARVTQAGVSGLRFTDERGRHWFCWDEEKMAGFIDWVESYIPEDPAWKALENRLKVAGMSERELASMIGISASKVHDWLTDIVRPSKVALNMIKEAIENYERQVRSGA